MRIMNNRSSLSLFGLYFICAFTFISCVDKDELNGRQWAEEEYDYEFPAKHSIDYSTRIYESVLKEDGFYHDYPLNKGVQNVIRRVDQLLDLSWTPVNDIPKHPNGFFQKGKGVTGIPYSFGAESDGVVGIDISLDTFISALRNPYSYMYTIDLRKPPYKEILAGPYYGVVCSSAVASFLGMDFHYVTYLLDSCPWLSRLPEQRPESIRLGDIIWQKDHVMLVYDIARNVDGSIAKVTIAEGNLPLTRRFTISFDEFNNRWNTKSYIIYCYTDIGKTVFNPSHYMVDSEIRIPYPASVCTARGDRVCFKKGDPVILNTLEESSCEVLLYKDNELYGSFISKDHHLILENLEYGNYFATVKHDNNMLEGSLFCVIDYDVQLSIVKKGILRVSFQSRNAEACYVAFCNSQYRYVSVFPLSNTDIERGYIRVPFSSDNCSVRVFFRGEYGRISSIIQKIPS